MELLKKIEGFIVKIECFSVIVLLLTICFLAFAQVILRNLFNFSFVWADVGVRMAVLWVAIIGASIATSDKGHIRIDFGIKPPPKPYDSYLDAFLALIAVIACSFFSLVSLEFLSVEIDTGSMINALHAPEWVFTLIFPIGFIVMTLKFLLLFIGHLHEARSYLKGGGAK